MIDNPTPWLDFARQELADHIHRSPDHRNKRIAEYLQAAGLPPNSPDTIPWCAAFVTWCLKQAGVLPPPTLDAWARSYLTWGDAITIPRTGCIVVFERNHYNPREGHVAFYLSRKSRDYVLVLGGNQSSAVSEALFPVAHVLGYRWPSDEDFNRRNIE